MFPNCLPPLSASPTEPTSVALAEAIEAKPVPTSLRETPVATTFVRRGAGGDPILLVHGFDSSVLEFRRLLPRLATQNETWAVDLLGFGFTERSPDLPVSPATILAHLRGFWECAIARPVMLVGASMGGATAIDFTLNYPEAVKSLVLLDSAGMSRGPIAGKFLFPPLDYFATEFLRNPKVRQSISENAYFDKTFASEDARICAAWHLDSPNWNRALASFTKSGGYGSFRDRLSEIRRPTLILWGRNDRILGTKDAEKFRDAIGDSKLVWIDNCGHVPHLERPDITAENILNFRNNP